MILEALITSQARIAVLTLLMLNPSKRYYLREIESLTDLPVRAVQRELARLEKVGLVLSMPEGNRKYYQANRESSVFPELQSLIAKTSGLGDLLRERLFQARAPIDVAFIFGSFAQGLDSTESDLDIFVIGEISGRELSGVLGPARQELLREINPVVMMPTEFAEKHAEENAFIQEVLKQPKIFLIGGEDELAKILGRAPATNP